MTKFKKLSAVVLGSLLAIGVGTGVVAHNDNAQATHAATTNTAIYTVTGKTAVTTSGVTPSGSTVAFVSTYTTTSQLTANNSHTLTLSGWANVKITSIVLSMK